MAVDFLDLNGLFVKGEIPEFLSTLFLKQRQVLPQQVALHLPHANLSTMLERKHKGIFSLNLKKWTNHFDDSKIILILQNEMFLLMLFCKRVLK